MCHSAGCKYVFYKYCERKTSSNIEQAGEMYTNNIHVCMYYCLKTNPLKDQMPLLASISRDCHQIKSNLKLQIIEVKRKKNVPPYQEKWIVTMIH